MTIKERRTRRCLVFSVCTGVLATLLAGTAAGATTWVVDDDDEGGAGVDYTTIQAVGAASDGDTTFVQSEDECPRM